MKFNENIRNLRKENDYSQEYLAEKLGVTRQTISKWENATAMPDLKKLTEIADFFEVSMDALLGMEFDTPTDKTQTSNANNENNYNAEYQKQYAEQLFSIAYQNQYTQNIANHKALKTIAIILSIAIACVILGLILLSNNLDSKINNLQGLISTLNSQNSIHQDYDDDNDNEFEFEFISSDKKNPYMINTEFKYAPSKYPKNAIVYLSINNSDGSTQRIDFEEENGLFTATAQIDVTTIESGYIYIDDGEIITKEEILDGFNPGDFIYFENNYIYNEYSNQENKSITEISFESSANAHIEITDAFLVTEKSGTVDHNEKLKIEKYTDEFSNTRFRLASDYEVPYYDYYTVYFKLIDKNNVEYRYYPEDERSEIIFTDGKALK